MFAKIFVGALRHVTQKLETSWLVWFGFCFSPQFLTSPNTRQNPRSSTAILAPAAARKPKRAFSSSVYMQIPVSEVPAWCGEQSGYYICKYQKKKKNKHFAVFEPISNLN